MIQSTDTTPLVLIHGSPATGQAWQAVAKHLNNHFQIITPTLLGHEGAGPAETPPSITTDALAAAVEAEIGAFDAPIRLAGHSYGASVALHLALRGRIPIGHMVLFEPVSPHALELAGKDASHQVLRAGIGGYVEAHEAGEPAAVSRMIDFWFGPGAFGAMPEPVKTYLIDRTPVNVRDVRAAFAETYTCDDLARLDFPIQVACGDKSPSVTLDVTNALIAGLPQGSLATIEGGDHAMLTTHPEVVANMIADFSG